MRATDAVDDKLAAAAADAWYTADMSAAGFEMTAAVAVRAVDSNDTVAAGATAIENKHGQE